VALNFNLLARAQHPPLATRHSGKLMSGERRATAVIKSPWERTGQDDPLLRHANRRSVQMRAFIVRGDDQIVDVSVTDLSYAGCAVHTETPLTKREEVRLSILGLKAVKATVRWYRGRMAGLSFDATEGQEHRPRRSDRIELKATALLRRTSRSGYQVQILDVSPFGCRCEFIERPSIGERVMLKFEGLGAIEASVRWVEGTLLGLDFARPIHEAVFNFMLARLRCGLKFEHDARTADAPAGGR